MSPPETSPRPGVGPAAIAAAAALVVGVGVGRRTAPPPECPPYEQPAGTRRIATPVVDVEEIRAAGGVCVVPYALGNERKRYVHTPQVVADSAAACERYAQVRGHYPPGCARWLACAEAMGTLPEASPPLGRDPREEPVEPVRMDVPHAPAPETPP